MSKIILNNSITTPETPASGKVTIYSGTDNIVRVLNSSGSITPITKSIAIFNDTKSATTVGGDFTSGADRTRVLNTTIINNITGCSLASNQITLLAGTYLINASCPAYKTSRHQCLLYNVTDSATALLGTSEYCDATVAIQTRSFINSYLIITSTKVFELRHRAETTSNSVGLGISNNIREEVYSTITIEKIA